MVGICVAVKSLGQEYLYLQNSIVQILYLQKIQTNHQFSFFQPANSMYTFLERSRGDLDHHLEKAAYLVLKAY